MQHIFNFLFTLLLLFLSRSFCLACRVMDFLWIIYSVYDFISLICGAYVCFVWQMYTLHTNKLSGQMDKWNEPEEFTYTSTIRISSRYKYLILFHRKIHLGTAHASYIRWILLAPCHLPTITAIQWYLNVFWISFRSGKKETPISCYFYLFVFSFVRFFSFNFSRFAYVCFIIMGFKWTSFHLVTCWTGILLTCVCEMAIKWHSMRAGRSLELIAARSQFICAYKNRKRNRRKGNETELNAFWSTYNVFRQRFDREPQQLRCVIFHWSLRLEIVVRPHCTLCHLIYLFFSFSRQLCSSLLWLSFVRTFCLFSAPICCPHSIIVYFKFQFGEWRFSLKCAHSAIQSLMTYHYGLRFECVCVWLHFFFQFIWRSKSLWSSYHFFGISILTRKCELFARNGIRRSGHDREIWTNQLSLVVLARMINTIRWIELHVFVRFTIHTHLFPIRGKNSGRQRPWSNSGLLCSRLISIVQYTHQQ